MSSEIQSRAAEIRALAADCQTLSDLRKKLGWNMESIIHANSELDLGLPAIRDNRAGAPRKPQPAPKPNGGKK